MDPKKKKTLIMAAIFLAALAGLMALLHIRFRPAAVQGSKSVTILVTGSSGETREYRCSTDAEYLKQAMDELAEADPAFSYTGSGGSYGIMIDTINGEKADYTKDGAYWALYVNGEYGSYGADAQPVNDGDTYEWRYEVLP